MTSTLRLSIDQYRAGARQEPHRHEELHLSLILRGGVAETVGGRTEIGGPLCVMAKDAGLVHSNLWSRRGTRLARLTLAGGTLASLAGDAPRTDGWRWTHDPTVARAFLRLVERQRRGECEFMADDADLLDLVAAFTARRVAEPQGTPPRWLADTMAHVGSAWQPRLRCANIAAHARVHPVYLARCIRRWYGVGLGEWLRALRLRAAIAAITDAEPRLSLIAMDVGYSDEPHLCRDVRRTIGMSPGRLRRLVQQVGLRDSSGARTR